MTGDAEVWLAHDEVLGKDVSLHFVPQSMVGDTTAMTELRNEVKRNRQLIHPNILRVYDLVEENGWAAISMDAFEGESLASRMAAKNGVLDPADLQAWLAPLAATLDDAHKINVLHRDLAPGDLYLGKDGKLLITNFGLGRCIADAVARLSGKAPTRLAARSPQQFGGATATRADDIYALGALVFQALTGRLPFVGDDLAGQVSKATPPTIASARPQNAPKVGEVWEKAVASCLAKEAGDRPSSALALGSLPVEAASASASVAAVPEKAAKAEKSAKVEKEKAVPAPEPTKAAAKPAEPAKPATKETIRETPKEPAKAVSETPAASPKTTTPDTSAPKKSVLETPIASSPERSRSPVLGLAIAAIIVGVVGYWLNSSKDVPTDEPPAGLTRTELPDGSDLRSVNNTVETPATKEEPVIPKAEPIAKVEPKTEPLVAPSKTEPTVAVPPNEISKSATVETPKPPVAMQTPAPAMPMLVAANATPAPATPAPVKPATPVPTKPAAATPTPAQGESEEDKVVAEKVAALEKAKQAAQAAEKAREGMAKQEKQAAAAVTEAQKALDQKLKAVAPVKKEADEVLAQRKKLEEDQKAADEAAAKAQKAADEAVAKARQLAEEKAKATEAAKKAIADLETKSKAKLSAQEKADAEVAVLQKTLTEKQQIVAETNKSASEVAADRAREQAAIKKGEEEVEQAKVVAAEARKAREEAEAERRRLARDLDDVQKMMEQKSGD
jgi:serine/threonine protein kinase